MKMFKNSAPMLLSLTLLACSSSDNEAVTPDVVADTPAPAPVTMKADDKVKVIPVDPSIPVLTLSFTPTKAFRFTWAEVPGAISYNIKEAITVASGFDIEPIFKTTNATVTTRSFDYVVPLHGRVNAKYILESCITVGDCAMSAEVHTSTRLTDMTNSIGYFKAGNTGASDQFGSSVSVSEDGSTLAVGASSEGSNSKDINNVGQDNNEANHTGAVYVFTRNGAEWIQEAYLKASNSDMGDFFGDSVSLSADGNTLAVGASGEASSGRTDPTNGSASNSGAAYVFKRSGVGSDVMWSQQAYIKASNAGSNDGFGASVSLSADGNTLAVGARDEGSAQKGVNPIEVENDNTLPTAGAVYVFARSVIDNTMWSEQAYIKASNTEAYDAFGVAVSLSADGNTLAVGATGESSIAIGINQDEVGNDAQAAGAVYVFFRTNTGGEIEWIKQAYLKASNTDRQDLFGSSVSISGDGNTLAVGAPREDSNSKMINVGQDDDSADDAGAVYVFTRSGTEWSPNAYLKASNADAGDEFGNTVNMSGNGKTLAVGAYFEDSDATGIDGVATNNLSVKSGAVYTFTRSADTTTWSQQAYIKASDTGGGDEFGSSVALSADGGTLAVSASAEDSNATGINADQENEDATDSGAVYVY